MEDIPDIGQQKGEIADAFRESIFQDTTKIDAIAQDLINYKRLKQILESKGYDIEKEDWIIQFEKELDWQKGII